ncbi:MAG: YlmC/YmxH family sporulation protein [Clostridia bacterium]|nr:YlmC/YmxH family sporulation protein [Clostridia bacterium]
MYERVGELQKKEVINISSGKRIGFVYDVEIDLQNGTVGSLIVPERNRFLGFFGKYEEHIISFETIVKVGDDIVLVDIN